MFTVYKIGGNVVDNPEALQRFLTEFASMPGRKVLVHGGGKEATRLSSALEIPTTMVNGRRVTDADTLRVVTMVYAGLVNKRLVAKLQALGCNAVGLCGADGNVVRSRRRPATPIDFGFVGDIDPSGVDSRLLASMIDEGLTPVLCAITHDGAGQLLNSNADSVAAAVAVALSREATTDLVYCFEQPGVMADVNDPTSLIARIDSGNVAALKQSGAISGGMIPKIDNALESVRSGVRSVVIRSADNISRPGGTVVCN